MNQNCQIRSVLIGLNLNWSDFDQIQTDLNWSDRFKIFLNWIWTADRIYLIWSEFDRSDSDQIQSDQFFLGALGIVVKYQKCGIFVFIIHLRNFLNITQNTSPRMDLFKWLKDHIKMGNLKLGDAYFIFIALYATS